jgi:hypothetical protein
MADKKKPEIIEDANLDEASGGISLLLPAVQKVREAAATEPAPAPTSITKTGPGTLQLGGNNS